MQYALISQANAITPADAQELAAFRFPNNRSLPVSYQAFAEEFGYGRSCGEFLLFVPLGTYCDSLPIRAEYWIGTYRDVFDLPEEEVWFDLGPDATMQVLKRLYPFAKSENGGLLFWDTGSGDAEMDIYYSDFRSGFIKVGETLYDFFRLMECGNNAVRREPLPMTFEPIALATASGR